MRPQNDGPASRAFAMTRFTRFMIHRYRDDIAQYYGNATNVTPLMKDLAYTAANWRKPSFEIWEEVKGSHFYTYMVQRRAMLDGAALALRLKDTASAKHYKQVAATIEKEIEKFWSPSKGYITVTSHRVGGIDYKKSELDSQVVLAALHAGRDDGFYTPGSDKILATWYSLVKAFAKLYPDNVKHKSLAPAIGRYPEDRYNGFDAPANGGNGWMLITTGMAECLYRARVNWRHAGGVDVTAHNVAFLRYITDGKAKFAVGEKVRPGKKFDAVLKALVAHGDSFLARVRLHTEKDGMHLSEQWNRNTGKQQGAEDLTWSYTSFVTAYRARQRALQA
jgi:glucoamylase